VNGSTLQTVFFRIRIARKRFLFRIGKDAYLHAHGDMDAANSALRIGRVRIAVGVAAYIAGSHAGQTQMSGGMMALSNHQTALRWFMDGQNSESCRVLTVRRRRWSS